MQRHGHKVVKKALGGVIGSPVLPGSAAQKVAALLGAKKRAAGIAAAPAGIPGLPKMKKGGKC